MLIVRQIQGLQWCIDKEYPRLPTKESDKPIQFWQLKKAGNKVGVDGLVRVLSSDLLLPDVLLQPQVSPHEPILLYLTRI